MQAGGLRPAKEDEQGKGCRRARHVIELLQESGTLLLELVKAVFHDILLGTLTVSGYRKGTRFKVLDKKGNPQLPDNDHDIADSVQMF